MNKKKIIWTVGTLAVTGLTAYAIWHKCQKECFICRHRNWLEGMVFVGGAVLGLTFNYWMRD